MTPRDVFGLVIRTFGLLGLCLWFYLFIVALAMKNPPLFFLSFIVSAAAGYMLKGAPLLLEFCYPSSRESRWQEDHARVSEGGERVNS
ncbi:MAG: hypothetical protein OSB10_07620 [Planctomycetota bacterium]|nr:hypothetical protein [Planctomycetota bacterium]